MTKELEPLDHVTTDPEVWDLINTSPLPRVRNNETTSIKCGKHRDCRQKTCNEFLNCFINKWERRNLPTLYCQASMYAGCLNKILEYPRLYNIMTGREHLGKQKLKIKERMHETKLGTGQLRQTEMLRR